MDTSVATLSTFMNAMSIPFAKTSDQQMLLISKSAINVRRLPDQLIASIPCFFVSPEMRLS